MIAILRKGKNILRKICGEKPNNLRIDNFDGSVIYLAGSNIWTNHEHEHYAQASDRSRR
jgi:hypothetical protein